MKKLAAVFVLLGSAASAHPGHDAALTGVAHWTLSPLHGLGLIALALALFGYRTYRAKE